jgi:hypothetical protein
MDEINPTAPLPTFDEWHCAKYGQSFAVMHLNQSARQDIALLVLAEELPKYLHEMLTAIRRER